jgi:hypothetical protein
VFGDPTYADAILDRLVHNAHRIDLAGESLRRRRSRSISKGLTTSLQLCQKSNASRVPASQATSSRIAGRHHLGISGRLRRNLQRPNQHRPKGQAFNPKWTFI